MPRFQSLGTYSFSRITLKRDCSAVIPFSSTTFTISELIRSSPGHLPFLNDFLATRISSKVNCEVAFGDSSIGRLSQSFSTKGSSQLRTLLKYCFHLSLFSSPVVSLLPFTSFRTPLMRAKRSGGAEGALASQGSSFYGHMGKKNNAWKL